MAFPLRPSVTPSTAKSAAAAASNSNRNGVHSAPTHSISAKDRKMIQSIKDFVGNGFSDIDIYLVLKESNMDPNESAHKLLNQDPFHEVKRRNRKKESNRYRNTEDTIKVAENSNLDTKIQSLPDRGVKHSGSFHRPILPGNGGTIREFRVVRDNRVNQGAAKELKPYVVENAFSPSRNDQYIGGAVTKGSAGDKTLPKHPVEKVYRLHSSENKVLHPRLANHVGSDVDEKLMVEGRRISSSNGTRAAVGKSNGFHHHSGAVSTSNSVGVYSSTDPVHVPSPESRPSAAVGAIKREVGVVGGRRLSMENTVKDSLASSNSFPGSALGRDHSLQVGFRPFSLSKSDQNGQIHDSEAVLPNVSVSRTFSNYQNNSKMHQPVSHHKGSQHNKEWKPKLSQKSSVVPGVIGTQPKAIEVSGDRSMSSDHANVDLQNELSGVDIYETQNVVIARHLRVAEAEKLRLTFGSFGVEVDNSMNFSSGHHGNGHTETINEDLSPSLSASVPEPSSDNASSTKQCDVSDDQTRISGSNSTADDENQLAEKSSSSPNLETYHDIGLTQDADQNYDSSEAHPQPESSELPNFAAYDSQSSYDISYFRPAMDRSLQGQGLSTPEVLNNHTASNVPMSTISMVQQQPTITQVYPQVLPHFTNVMPYRQFLSPVYVPQMAMPGYSSNPPYPHPSNGNSYLLMPGGSSHLSANGLKYGIQQFKTVPSGSPTGYGNFSNPAGYTLNNPGAVGNGAGLDDSSRIKYKDGSIYVPNPQAETSEIWVQNPRDLQSLQSSAYYNLPGQTPHAAYLPSHTGHASFNAAAQSSHMQFSGLYPPQPTAIANPHHLGQVMAGNVSVGITPNTPTAQVGAYQQPQMGHINWATNF